MVTPATVSALGAPSSTVGGRGIYRTGGTVDTIELIASLARADARHNRTLRAFARHFEHLGPRGLHAWAQRIPFVPEQVETLQEPIETVLYGGDCDDHARVVAAIAEVNQWPWRLIGLGSPPTHVVVQLWGEGGWRWAETTVRAAWDEHPIAAARRLGVLRRDLDTGTLSGMNLDPKAKQPNIQASTHAWARDVLTKAWPTVATAPAISPFAIQLVMAKSCTEGVYGRGWKGPMSTSNNWGSISAGKGAKPPECSPNSLPHADHTQDGTVYLGCYLTYPTPEAGAADLLRHMGHKVRPMTAAAIEQEDDAIAISEALYRERYFGASCAEAIRKHGSAATKFSAWGKRMGNVPGSPEDVAAGDACDAEAVRLHASALYLCAKDIAEKLGEPLLLRFDDGGGPPWWAWLLGLGAPPAAYWAWKRFGR